MPRRTAPHRLTYALAALAVSLALLERELARPRWPGPPTRAVFPTFRPCLVALRVVLPAMSPPIGAPRLAPRLHAPLAAVALEAGRARAAA